MKNGGVIKGLELRAHRGDGGREKEEEKREQIQTANPKQRGRGGRLMSVETSVPAQRITATHFFCISLKKMFA